LPKWLCALLGAIALLLGGAVAHAQAVLAQPAQQTRVYLATMAPGELYFERFGHNALVVFNARDTPAVAYNFGYFDFNGKDFLRNFVFGKMAYLGVALNAQDDLQHYISNKRAVWLQELALNATQTARLVANLNAQTTVPNDVYRYDYFRNNCSTKVRDALDDALGGALKANLSGRSHGASFRSLGLSHAAQPLWLYLGIHAGLGPRTDQTLDIFEESFIPAALQNALVGISLTAADGSRYPLVKSTQMYGVEADVSPQPNVLPRLPDWRWHFLVAGIALSIVIALGIRHRANYFLRRLSALIAGTSALALGLGGVLLLFLMTATDHDSSYWNINVALFSPLWLLCVPSAFASAFAAARNSGTLARCAAHVALAIGLASIAIKVFPQLSQRNIEWALFCAPVLIALHFAVCAKRQSVA
jgi:hypothetical protein